MMLKQRTSQMQSFYFGAAILKRTFELESKAKQRNEQSNYDVLSNRLIIECYVQVSSRRVTNTVFYFKAHFEWISGKGCPVFPNVLLRGQEVGSRRSCSA